MLASNAQLIVIRVRRTAKRKVDMSIVYVNVQRAQRLVANALKPAMQEITQQSKWPRRSAPMLAKLAPKSVKNMPIWNVAKHVQHLATSVQFFAEA
ncbi:hypothetical protein BH10BAC6_BH10BAC6_05350 [soil metagenome]